MIKVFLTCEHGGNQIPSEYKDLFKESEAILTSHRGWDIGILKIAKGLAQHFDLTLHYSEVSRLLVELNRSLDNPDLFSSHTNSLPSEEKLKILNQFYFPYRNKVEQEIEEEINTRKSIAHISVHSFTPILNGIERDCDIGLLFNPARFLETEFCEQWKEAIEKQSNSLKVKFNYPYKGIEDGFTTYLRTKFPDDSYAGIEVEVNQKLLQNKSESDFILNILSSSLRVILNPNNTYLGNDRMSE